MELFCTAAELELRLTHDIQEDRDHPHQKEPESAETTGDHIRQLARLEVLVPSLVPADEDDRPTANEQCDTDVKRSSGRGFHAP